MEMSNLQEAVQYQMGIERSRSACSLKEGARLPGEWITVLSLSVCLERERDRRTDRALFFLSATEFTIPWRTIIRHGGCRLSVCVCVPGQTLPLGNF